MTELKNDTFLRALLREPVDYTPVWMMRQAGRYLPEYRETRAKAGSFMDLCRSPELACEVTIQPLERFPLDAAILFSDILTIPDAMGLGLSFAEGEGPQFARPVRTAADIDAIAVPDPEDELRYVMDAVALIRKELDGRVPLIGFSGAPWTLATYMIEGASAKNFAHSKALMFDQPNLMHNLLGKVADSVTSYLNAQIARGAQAVMVFDTWGGVLTPSDFREFSLRYMERIVDGLTREADGRRVPVVLFAKGAGQWLDRMAETGCDALGVDWTTDLADARKLVRDKVALQGNLDPCTLYASPERIQREVGRVLASYGRGTGHVFNLGHGIHPDINPDHAAAMVAAVHEQSRPYHA
ncbi:MAG: uroporphyrinogen decarboxylase [Lamprobacter sp.]|uniref:uroporphyrinogen decarboxylase n=1 Tax=Lamprobacter sp. TaxID=3100796 RepID=UPI002B25A6CE|nr:uroporphyrinogen decarboxylase [Lamprobacter sp.]MEA3638703.1 uroporphyrinogen decarboxylase [Lamprobacter sp.]